MKINADYCGNIKFVEYDATSANTVIQLCKEFLEESLCLIVKQYVKCTFNWVAGNVYNIIVKTSFALQ